MGSLKKEGVNDPMKNRSWNIVVISGLLILLSLAGGMVYVIDPYLHYHKPLESLQYPLKDERYINDGIARNYEYEAMITGTSMTQNLDNYMDVLHYGEWINEEIMKQIHAGNGRLTNDNYQQYFDKIRTLYTS